MAFFSRRQRSAEAEVPRREPGIADTSSEDALRAFEDLFSPAPAVPDGSVRATRHVAISAGEIGLPEWGDRSTSPERQRRHAPHLGFVDSEPTSIPTTPAPESPDPERGPSLSPTGTVEERVRMANLDQSVQELLAIDGATAASLVDAASGMALAQGGHPGFDLGIAAAGNSNVVRAKLQTMKELGLSGKIDDILITLDDQYHLINVLDGDYTGGLFVYLVLDRARANLALARHKLSAIAGRIDI